MPSQKNSNAKPPESLTLNQRRAFLKLPLAKRQSILKSQAEAMESHYKQDTEWREWLADDIIEC